MIYNYVKGGGSQFWLVVFNYFSLYRLKTMSINKIVLIRARTILTPRETASVYFILIQTLFQPLLLLRIPEKKILWIEKIHYCLICQERRIVKKHSRSSNAESIANAVFFSMAILISIRSSCLLYSYINTKYFIWYRYLDYEWHGILLTFCYSSI